jgi:hypothetical protein
MDHLNYRAKITWQSQKKERKKQVIDLYYNQGKTTREIAKIERKSIRDISAIIKEEEARRQKYKQQELSAKAYKLFSEGKTSIEVAVILNLPASKVSKLYREYWKLRGLDKLNAIYKETNGKLSSFLKLYKRLIKEKGMSIEQVVNVVEIAIHKLPYMESLYRQAKDQAQKVQRTIQRLANDIEARKYKISILDKIVFSAEQDCKKTKQEMQELTAKNDKLEKFVSNVANNDEGYAKLNQFIKENVKAILSDNKKLMSVSFAALLQTLTSDPKMINIIYKILTANDNEQHKDDNNNNAIKYLESNMDNILDLVEKHYENLVEALTNNAIATASSNPKLALPQ